MVKPPRSQGEAAGRAQQVPRAWLPVPSYANTPLARFTQPAQMQPEQLPARREEGEKKRSFGCESRERVVHVFPKQK